MKDHFSCQCQLPLRLDQLFTTRDYPDLTATQAHKSSGCILWPKNGVSRDGWTHDITAFSPRLGARTARRVHGRSSSTQQHEGSLTFRTVGSEESNLTIKAVLWSPSCNRKGLSNSKSTWQDCHDLLHFQDDVLIHFSVASARYQIRYYYYQQKA